MRSDPRVVRRCRAITSAAAVFVAVSGVLGLCGWIFHVEIFKALLSPGLTMKANSALCLMLAGGALWLLRSENPPVKLRRAGMALAAALLLVATATLIEHLSGSNLRIDQLLFTEAPGAAATVSPGRMSPAGALALVLCALALLLLDSPSRRDRAPSQYLAIVAAMITFLSLIGYTYGIQPLYNVSNWTAIAAHTSVAMTVLCAGLLCARCEYGPMAIVTAEGAGGAMARRLLGPAILLPICLGWFRTIIERHIWTDPAVIRPVMILFTIAVFSTLIWWNARTLTRLDVERARVDQERRTAEAEVRASEARFRRVAECGMIGIVFGDISGDITDANDAFLKIVGATRDDLRAGKLRWRDLTPPEYVAADEKAIEEMKRCGIAAPFEKEYLRPDGVRVPILLGAAFQDGSRTQTVAFVLDLSERRRAEDVAREQRDAILHLARVTTVGEMAAGLAHELNQPLGAIVNYAGAALEATYGSEQTPALLTEALEDIAAESKRAGDIIRRLRDFVRKQKPKVSPVQINALIREALELLAAELRRSGVRWKLELAADLPAAIADSVQIEQVLVNLLRNAIDAMSEVRPSERRLLLTSEAPDAATVRVKVIDSGCGGEQKVLNAMFDAFFTTKPDGMGMGLAICRSIIEAHGGHIRASANPQAGLTVEFTLPAAPAEVAR